MRAWLIRHGESEANAGARSSDPAGIPLTDRGSRQAKLLADRLPASPTRIVTSSYLRTEQTAAPSREAFPTVHERWNVHEFTYLAPARCRDTTAAERSPLVEAFWARCDPSYVDGEGAESFASLLGRASGLTGRLRDCGDDERVVVFTHGQFMRAVLWTLLASSEATPESMRRFRAFSSAIAILNGAIVPLRISRDEAWTGPVQTEHLPPDLRTT